MADSFGKKEREKKREQKRKAKEIKKQQLKEEGGKTAEFMYMNADGQLTTEKPDPDAYREEISMEEIMISVPKKEDLIADDPMRIGIVTFFNTDKGYGFIKDKENNESYFVHINNVEGELKENNKVSFEIGTGPKGKVAINVKLYKL